VKTRRLPEIDLARIAPLPATLKRSALEQHKAGFPPFDYHPFRSALPDLVNQADMFGPTAPTSWDRVERQIQRRSRSVEEFDANCGVARSLHRFAESLGMTARRMEFFPLTLGTGTRVVYWHPVLLLVEGRPTVPFFDPRRSRRLSEQGRRFAFSVMHERIRVGDPDLAEVDLAIFQFDSLDEGARGLRVHRAEGVTLFSFDELNQMVTETYGIWTDVLGERDEEARRRGRGSRGPLI
jgi:hypothetical protein